MSSASRAAVFAAAAVAAAGRRRAAGRRDVGRLAGQIGNRRRRRPRRRGRPRRGRRRRVRRRRRVGAGGRRARGRAAAGARVDAAAAAVASPVCGTIFGAGVSGFVSSAIYSHQFTNSPFTIYPIDLQRLERRLPHPHAAILLAQARRPTACSDVVLERRRRAQAADHHLGNRIAIVVLPHVARDRLLDVRAIEHLPEHRHAVVAAVARERDRGVPAHVGRSVLSAVRSVTSCASPGSAPSAYTTILRIPASGDS